MASYNIMSSGRRGWSTQSWLLFIYSAVVTFALVLVVSRNFETPEQIVAEERRKENAKTPSSRLSQKWQCRRFMKEKAMVWRCRERPGRRPA